MDSKQIRHAVETLPFSSLGEVQDDDEIFEVRDGGASVKVTKHYLPTPGWPPILSMTVSGPAEERERVVQEFIDVYGPTAVPVESEPHMDTAVWLNPQARD